MTRVIAPYPSDTFDRLADLIGLVLDAKAVKKYVEEMKACTEEMAAERVATEKLIVEHAASAQKAEKAAAKAEAAAAKAEAEKEAAKIENDRLAATRGEIQSASANIESRRAELDEWYRQAKGEIDGLRTEALQFKAKAETDAAEAERLRDVLSEKLALLQA